MLPNNSFRPLYLCLSTNIYLQLVTIPPKYFSKWNSWSNSEKKMVKNLEWFFATCCLSLYSSSFPLQWTSSNHFQHFLWIPCWPNQSGYLQCSTHILLLWAFRIIDAILFLYVRFIFCLQVVLNFFWIIRVTIRFKPILSVWKAVRCTGFITLGWMAIYCFDSEHVYYHSSSFRKILWRQSWWQRGSVQQSKCSRTIMLIVWPGSFDYLFSIWNVSYGWYLLVVSVRLLLCTT